MELGLV